MSRSKGRAKVPLTASLSSMRNSLNPAAVRVSHLSQCVGMSAEGPGYPRGVPDLRRTFASSPYD